MSSSPSSDEEIRPCQCLKQAEELKKKERQIVKAVQENDVRFLKALLNSPRWYKVRDQDNFPLIQIAMIRNSREVFDYLLSLPDYPLEAINDDENTALMLILADDFMTHVYEEDVVDHMREYFACKLIERGADVHRVSLGGTLLHSALERNLIDVAKLLIKKGVDVNKQDYCGNTPLHVSCDIWHNENFTEDVSMLLFEGADPMIRNCKGYTPFDLILKFAKCDRVGVETILFNYIIDQYTQYDIHVEAFLMAAELDSLIFYDVIKNTREVVFSEYVSSHYISMLFIMQTHFLQILIEEFDYVVKELMTATFVSFMYCEKPILIENFHSLMNSKLQLEFTEWLSTVDMRGVIWNLLHFKKTDKSTMQGIICLLLSYGMKVFEGDLEIVYQEFGYCELFKILLHMDVEGQLSNPIRSIMPYILFNVTLDIPEMILNRQILLSAKLVSDLEQLLPYYTIPCELLRSSSLRKAQRRRKVPLLLELARNAFRRYFVERLGIKYAKQFYTLVNKLPIGKYQKQILTLEATLY